LSIFHFFYLFINVVFSYFLNCTFKWVI